MGVTLAGSVEDASRFAQEYAAEVSQCSEATIFGTDQKTHSSFAALCNGIASHANDYNDCSETEIGHPSITVLPTVFAVGERVGASGKDLIRAYLIGVEVQNKVSVLALPETSKRGWHTTCVFGHIGSVVAAGVLMELDKEQFANSIGITASQAGGLRGNFGTMTKPYHAGHACFNGIAAANLGGKGLTSAKDIIESEQGFVQLFAGRAATEQALGFGAPWDIVDPGFQIKLYPSCSASHPASEALFNILKERPIDVDEVESIHAGIGLLGINELLCHNPVTPDEARFSMEYALAAPIVHGQITLDEFEQQAIDHPDIKPLMGKVTMAVDDELALLGLTADEPCKLTVTLKNGEVLKERCMLAKGQPGKPLTTEELKEKFLKCAGRIYAKEQGEKIFNQLLNLDKLPEVENLMEIM